jgi:hypothetical protein
MLGRLGLLLLAARIAAGRGRRAGESGDKNPNLSDLVLTGEAEKSRFQPQRQFRRLWCRGDPKKRFNSADQAWAKGDPDPACRPWSRRLASRAVRSGVCSRAAEPTGC